MSITISGRFWTYLHWYQVSIYILIGPIKVSLTTTSPKGCVKDAEVVWVIDFARNIFGSLLDWA